MYRALQNNLEEIMTIKKNSKKVQWPKKLLTRTSKSVKIGSVVNKTSTQTNEASIKKQFRQIRRDYTRLMNDFLKGIKLVKKWGISHSSTK
jgi:hypothetical protein